MSRVDTALPALETEFLVSDGYLSRVWRLPDRQVESRVLFPGGATLADWWGEYLRGVVPEAGFDAGAVSTVELFCGPGGLAQGFRQGCAELGFSCQALGAVDQDRGAVEVYAANHRPKLTANSSVTTLVDHAVVYRDGGAEFLYPPEIIDPAWAALRGSVSAVLAGPPCQGHSNLNNKTRRDDPRNRLYLTVPAVAVALDAPIVIIENVPSVINDRKGVVGDAVDLLEGNGYYVTHGVLRADELGWPQTRSRFFLVARRDQHPIELAEVVAALRQPEPLPVMWAIEDLQDSVSDSPMNCVANLSEENKRRIAWLFENDQFDLVNSERPDCHKDGTTYKAVYGRMRADRPAPTLTTGFMTPGRGRFTHPTRQRTLTPREAARIQGFPDSYVFEVGDEPTKSELTKWIGDAVPMPLGYAAAIAALGPGPVSGEGASSHVHQPEG